MEAGTYRSSEDAAAVDRLLAACRAAGDHDPLSEGKRLALGGTRGRSIVVRAGSALVGFAQLVAYTGHRHPPGTGRHDHPEAHWEGEFLVEPAWRDEASAAVAGAAVAAAPAGMPLELWAAEPYQAEALHRLGWRPVRVLHRMEVTPIPAVDAAAPPGYRIEGFVPGRDEDAFLRANHEIFASHPEQSSWDREALAERLHRPWFDPEGFLVARHDGGRVVGFCWTKVHPGERPAGEIFLIGVVDDVRGTGLGRALTAAGLRHLAGVPGVERAMLYVSGDNAPALGMYRKMGFTVAATREVYRPDG